jgi:hypothetical protein
MLLTAYNAAMMANTRNATGAVMLYDDTATNPVAVYSAAPSTRIRSVFVTRRYPMGNHSPAPSRVMRIRVPT